jgi:hypothetical protein
MGARLRRRSMHKALAAWSDTVATSALEQTASEDDAAELARLRTLRRLLAAWREASANAAAAGSTATNLRERSAERHLAAVFQTWRLESSQSAGRRLGKLAAAAGHLSVLRSAAMFVAWRQSVIERGARDAAADSLWHGVHVSRKCYALAAWQEGAAHSRGTQLVADARWTACHSRTVGAALAAWQMLAADQARCRGDLLKAHIRGAAAVKLHATFGSWRQLAQRLNQARAVAEAAGAAREGRTLSGAFQGWRRRAQGAQRRRLHRAQASR